MREVNIQDLKRGFKGKRFNLLIKAHLRKHKKADYYRQATLDTIEMLPLPARRLAVDFIDKWNEQAYNKEFWCTDTSVVFTQIVEDARVLLSEAGAPTDDETLFNMFQIVVLSYVYSASDQPKMQKYIGI